MSKLSIVAATVLATALCGPTATAQDRKFDRNVFDSTKLSSMETVWNLIAAIRASKSNDADPAQSTVTGIFVGCVVDYMQHNADFDPSVNEDEANKVTQVCADHSESFRSHPQDWGRNTPSPYSQGQLTSSVIYTHITNPKAQELFSLMVELNEKSNKTKLKLKHKHEVSYAFSCWFDYVLVNNLEWMETLTSTPVEAIEHHTPNSRALHMCAAYGIAKAKANR